MGSEGLRDGEVSGGGWLALLCLQVLGLALSVLGDGRVAQLRSPSVAAGLRMSWEALASRPAAPQKKFGTG